MLKKKKERKLWYEWTDKLNNMSGQTRLKNNINNENK